MMPLTLILVVEIFNIWWIDFIRPFLVSHVFECILVVVDYVTKWVEALATRTNDHQVVIKFTTLYVILYLLLVTRVLTS